MTNEVDFWIYFGGPEPAHIKPLLDSMRELPPLSHEDTERLGEGVMERIDEAISRRAESSVSGERSRRRSVIAEDEPISEEEPRSAPAAARLFSEEGPTAISPSFDEYIHAWPSPAPRPRRSSVEVRAARAPEGQTITEQVLELPPAIRAQMGCLPFKPALPAAASPPAPEVQLDTITMETTTMEVPVMRPIEAETFPLGDTSVQGAIAVLPFVGSTVGTGLVAFPRLTIEQYASFRVELSLWPKRSAQIHHRYHVANNAARAALEEHWKSHFEERPEARAKFEEAFAEYMDWSSEMRVSSSACATPPEMVIESERPPERRLVESRPPGSERRRQ
jgi:hypothetical protein